MNNYCQSATKCPKCGEYAVFNVKNAWNDDVATGELCRMLSTVRCGACGWQKTTESYLTTTGQTKWTICELEEE